MLQEHQRDIFGNKEEQSWNLVQEPLIDEPLIPVGSSKYIRRHLKNGPALESLLQCQFVSYKTHAPELKDWFFHHYNSSFRQLDIVLTVESVQAIINAVQSNLGLGIVPQYLVQSYILKKQLEPIRVGKDEVRSRISFLKLEGRKPGISERLFVELIKSKFAGK